MKKKQPIKVSDVCEKALDDLEKVEIEWTADEITMKKVQGRMILHLKSGHTGTA